MVFHLNLMLRVRTETATNGVIIPLFDMLNANVKGRFKKGCIDRVFTQPFIDFIQAILDSDKVTLQLEKERK